MCGYLVIPSWLLVPKKPSNPPYAVIYQPPNLVNPYYYPQNINQPQYQPSVQHQPYPYAQKNNEPQNFSLQHQTQDLYQPVADPENMIKNAGIK